MEDFQTIPEIFKDKIFSQAFEKAEIANYSSSEKMEYEQSLKVYRDYKNTIDSAFDEGKLEGKIEIARKLKDKGLAIEFIAETTGLTEKQILNL